MAKQGKDTGGRRGRQTSSADIVAALNAANGKNKVSVPIASIHSDEPVGTVSMTPRVRPRFSVMLHINWTDAPSLRGSEIEHRWKREQALYNLVTSQNKQRFFVDGNDSKILHDKDTGFVETVASLEFFDLAVTKRPSEFVTKDPFDYLKEFGIDIPPYENAEKKVREEVKAELEKLAKAKAAKKPLPLKKVPKAERDKVKAKKKAPAASKTKTKAKTKAKSVKKKPKP